MRRHLNTNTQTNQHNPFLYPMKDKGDNSKDKEFNKYQSNLDNMITDFRNRK